MKVRDIMVKNPVTATVPGSRGDVLRLMVKHNKTGLPVVKKGKKPQLVGFITRQDIFSKPNERQLALLVNKKHPNIKPEADVKKAARILLDNTIYHLPVVKDKKVVGIVTPADLLPLVEKKRVTTSVMDYIRSPCIPIYRGTPINVALRIIRLTDVYALPVLDDTGELCGIITDRDIFNITKEGGSIAISDLGLGDDEDEWSWEGLRNVMKLYYEESMIELPKINVEDAMIKSPTAVYMKTGISKAARTMRKNDFGQLPVLDSKNRLKAMIYELDAVAAMFE